MSMSMRRLLVFVFVFLFAFGSAQQGLQPYARPDLGFSVGYPSGWQVTENVEDGDSFFVLAPDNSSPISGEVAVEILLGTDVTTDLEGSVAEILPEVLASFPGFREVSRGDLVVAGLPAKIVEVRGMDQRQNEVTWQLVFVLSGDRGYLVILEALSAAFPTHQPVLQQILGSFTVTQVQASGGQPPLAPDAPQTGGNLGQPPLGQQPATGGQPQPSGEYGSIALGGAVSGVIAASPNQDSLVYHTYVVTVPAGTPSLAITVQGGGADLDLAVKFGSPIVTYDDVDFLDTSEDPNPVYQLQGPPAGLVYIDVLNLLPNDAAYTLSVTGGGQPGSAPLAPGGTTPGAPGGANPLAPATPGGANPLAPAPADPFVGRFAGNNLTLELAGSSGQYSGQLVFGGQTYPVSAQAAANTLNGTFQSGGSAFAFTATLDGNTLVFVTDGNSYTLQKSP